MRISLEWLADYLPEPINPERAAEALTHGGFPVESIESIGTDSILDVEVTSNRGDCLSHRGIARELAALLGLGFQDRPREVRESATPTGEHISVSVESPELCPRYAARIIRNIEIRPAPVSIAARIERMGTEKKPLRPINNVVDVTNYVLFDVGQPLHAFDLDKLEGSRIVVRNARAGEKLTTIDGKERLLSADMLVIADAVRPVALAGVMGGRDSEVTQSTKNILLESARFDPLSIRRTARALAMGSDSSYRFERGIDPALQEPAAIRAAELILKTDGGELLRGVVSAGSAPPQPKRISLRWTKLKQVLGVELPRERVMAALRGLRLAPTADNDRIDVTIPTDRLDLAIEADLVEEVARVVGYGVVPVREDISIRLTPPEPEQKPLATALRILSGAGFFEAVTFSFVSDGLAADFIPRVAEGPGAPDATSPLLRAHDSVRKADAFLRPSILPGLLEALRTNQSAGTAEPKLYEIGSTFWNKAGGGVEERRRIGMAGPSDLREIRGIIEAILRKFDATRSVQVIPDQQSGFARGACGRVEWGGKPVGCLGRIDRSIVEKLSLREIPSAAELEWDALLSGAQSVPQLRPPPRFPAIRRDLSLVVPESTPFAAISDLIRSVSPKYLNDVEFVTTYRGKPMEKGQKSVTVTLVFRSPDETLGSEQAESSVGCVIEAAREKLGATIRA